MQTRYNNFKTLGPQSAKLITTLYQKAKSIFKLQDVREILGKGDLASRSFIRKLVNRGVVNRLKPGLFIIVPYELGTERVYTGDMLLVIREMLDKQDYYFSYGTAMDIYGMKTHPQLVVYVSTIKSHRPLNISGNSIKFIKNRNENMFGITEYWVNKQERVRVSDVERTVIDGLRFPEYCGGITEVAGGLLMKRKDISVDRLIEYAVKLNIGAVIRRLGYLMELYKICGEDKYGILSNKLSATYVRLDPLLPAEGRFYSKWKLQVNVNEEELAGLGRT